MQRSAKQIHKYSRQTREKPEWKTRGGAAPEDFPQGFFLEFGVNILCSAEQSSAYCHYSSFFGRHNHSIFTPRGDIEYQYSLLGVILNIKNIWSIILHSTLVLWRQKTWNNGEYRATFLAQQYIINFPHFPCQYSHLPLPSPLSPLPWESREENKQPDDKGRRQVTGGSDVAK